MKENFSQNEAPEIKSRDFLFINTWYFRVLYHLGLFANRVQMEK
jgi:hypothetical protein